MNPARFNWIVLAASLCLAGCLSTTNFKSYDDGGAHYLGRGGAKEVVDGIELWTNGSPPRVYQVIGLIEDTRRKAVLPMATFKTDLVKAIKEHGGTAGIILTQGVQQLGTYTPPSMTTSQFRGTATQTGYNRYSVNGTQTTQQAPAFSFAISDQVTTVAVIRYVE